MSLLPRRVSSFTFLALLLSAVVVPLMVFGGFILYAYADSETERLRREALIAARLVTSALDREVAALISTAETLATSRPLAAGDTGAFHADVQALAAAHEITVLLRDERLAEVIDSSRPFGSTPPEPPQPPLEPADLAGGRPVVSGVYARPGDGAAAIAVFVPVAIGGRPHLLGVSRETGLLLEQIAPSIPPGWLVGVGDRAGRYVLRSVDNARWTGEPTLAEYTAKAVGQEGTFTSINVTGIELLAGYVHSDLSGWLVAANIPAADARRPLRDSALVFAGLGAVALLISASLAVLVGRHLTGSMSDLAGKALAVGRGEVIEADRSILRELELAGRSLARASRDLAERARDHQAAMRHQQLLADELNHRVKNTLASVQAMVTQTLRNATSLDDARDAITARLIALARAQDVLTRENWDGADVAAVIEMALQSHRGAGRVFDTDGPPVRLAPRAALALALALHELCTNAIKYGALSVDGGVVAVRWWVTIEEPARFALIWTESGGPPVAEPTRRGFGSRLIERGLGSELFATVSVTYAPDGVVFHMETDLAHLQESAKRPRGEAV